MILKFGRVRLPNENPPAASVIDSSTGGTLLTNGMPGTCTYTHSRLGGVPGAAGCTHNSKLIDRAKSSQSLQFWPASIRQAKHTLYDQAQAVVCMQPLA